MKTTRALAYVAMFFGGFIAVSLVNFWLVITPPKIIIGGTPADFGLSTEDVVLTADDGTRLAGWFIPERTPAPARRAIIFLHGYPAEKSDMLSIAAPLHDTFGIFLMDLRSFGASEGAYTTLGLKEQSDVSKAVDFLKARGYDRIGIFGFSLGGAVAILAAEEDSRIETVATYAAFADLRQLGYETYRGLSFLKYPFVRLLELWGRMLFGEWFSDDSPAGAAARLDIPLLLIHSRNDEQIPFAHFEKLRSALSKNARMEPFVIAEGLHGELPPDFSARVQKFFEKTL